MNVAVFFIILGNVFQPNVPILSDPNNLSSELAKIGKIGNWKNLTTFARAQFLKSLNLKKLSYEVDMNEIISYLRNKLPGDVIICSGAGNFSLWNNNYFQYRSLDIVCRPAKRISATNLQNPDFVKIAESYGFYAAKIKRTIDFYNLFEKALKSKSGAIFDIHVSVERITPEKNLSELKK